MWYNIVFHIDWMRSGALSKTKGRELRQDDDEVYVKVRKHFIHNLVKNSVDQKIQGETLNIRDESSLKRRSA